ncbi:TPA: hypothetical protein ACY4PY_002664 [Enterobacter cloacae]|uniref:hypothetical protein n=1 Tax=Enterobacter cloacae TaxID=550 RepID=UPI0030EF8B49
MVDHDVFIKQLSQDAGSIRRTLANPWRVVGWLLMALPCGWLSSLAFPRVGTD